MERRLSAALVAEVTVGGRPFTDVRHPGLAARKLTLAAYLT